MSNYSRWTAFQTGFNRVVGEVPPQRWFTNSCCLFHVCCLWLSWLEEVGIPTNMFMSLLDWALYYNKVLNSLPARSRMPVLHTGEEEGNPMDASIKATGYLTLRSSAEKISIPAGFSFTYQRDQKGSKLAASSWSSSIVVTWSDHDICRLTVNTLNDK